MNMLGIRQAIISMNWAGMTEFQIAIIIQEIHAWAIFHERIRMEALHKENPPKFPEISELQHNLKEYLE